MGETVMKDASEDEEGILHRSTKRNKGRHPTAPASVNGGDESRSAAGEARRTYRDSVMGGSDNGEGDPEERDEEGDVSDDVVEEGDVETWFGMGMMREEKIEARRPWRNSLIIKLVGRSIGYLWKRN